MTDNEMTYIEKGKEYVLKEDNTSEPEKAKTLKQVKDRVHELLNVKNVHFLLGAGASSPAIPVMSKLQENFEKKHIKKDTDNLYTDIKGKGSNELNLEEMLGKLYAAKHASEILKKGLLKKVERLIDKITDFLFDQVNKDINSETDVFGTYKDFYQSITFRNKDLARINVFTTNYDLFSEHALDELHIDYNSGFGGGLNRYFNPARFHYTFAQKLDPSIEKFEPIENIVYLYKLHGSINWRKANQEKLLFDIEEHHVPFSSKPKATNRTLIYPSPLKEGDTLAGPYSDLMREMKAKLMLPNSVLFIVGYGFRDTHINNIIYQAMSVNAAFSIFIFGIEKGKLLETDPRFYQLYEDEKKEYYFLSKRDKKKDYIHYFKIIAKDILPSYEINKDKKMLEDLFEKIKSKFD